MSWNRAARYWRGPRFDWPLSIIDIDGPPPSLASGLRGQRLGRRIGPPSRALRWSHRLASVTGLMMESRPQTTGPPLPLAMATEGGPYKGQGPCITLFSKTQCESPWPAHLII